MLVVEDEVALAKAVCNWFSRERYAVETVSNGLDACRQLRSDRYDIVVLDLLLPGRDGLDICKDFRAAGGSAGILVTSALDSLQEKETVLDAGADDYLIKPFHLRELSARVRALLRRTTPGSDGTLRIANIALDSVAGSVTRDGEPVHLHPMEFNLLEFLMKHPNHVFSTQALWERVWTGKTGELIDTVRTHIKTLRRKIDTTGRPSLIETVHGRGYKITTGHNGARTSPGVLFAQNERAS